MKRRFKTAGMINASQRGFVSLVFVVLVSLAITATSVGVVHTIKKTQEINVASNAITHSQNGAWVGVEAFREYLTTLDRGSIQNLSGDYIFNPVDLTASSAGNLMARNVSAPVILPDGSYAITAQIVNVHSSAKSSAVIETTFNVVMVDPTQIETSELNFDGDLKFTGGLNLILDTGEPVDLVVSGNVELLNVGINPINSITAGETISIGSEAEVHYIYANDDVSLTGGAKATEVHTLGTFTSRGGGGAGGVWANDNVDIMQNVRGEDINSVMDISIGAGGPGGYGVLTAGGTLKFTGLGETSKIDAGRAVGNIGINLGTAIDEVVSESDITCPSPSWDKTITVQAKGSVHNCSTSHPGIAGGVDTTVVPMKPLDPFPYNDLTIDVWKIKEHANYHVSYDSASKKKKVTVYNVAGITDGSVYYVGNYNDSGTPYRDYLCTSTDSSNNCLAKPVLPLCFGWGPYSTCLTYSESKDTFAFAPGDMAPYIYFFEGNVKFNNGAAVSTILASGNIDMSDSLLTATNEGSYSKICEANSDHVTNPINAVRYLSVFSTHFATNLCDKAAGIYTPIPTGNIALAAGGIDPDGSGAYTGGDINLKGSVIGSVLAGNTLNTGGQTSVHGLVSSAGDGASNTIWGGHVNKLQGSTTVNLTTVPGSTFTPTIIPNFGSGTPTVTVTLQGARNL